tara:strand:- start:61 stop:1218 length:1158 start_codon:yes stop_codon:yes gene_type:complete
VTEKMTKYISFSPYFSGLANIIMSYEIFLSIAAITGRKVILPPDCWMIHICKSQNKKDWRDIWEIFDKNVLLEEFDCIDHRDVPEFQARFNMMQSERSYTGKLKKLRLDIKEIFFNKNEVTSNCHITIANGILETEDFEKFKNGRDVVDVSCDNQFLHFENNLFGHYWYHVYPGGEKERNDLKDKINRVFKYHPKYYECGEVVRSKIGPYNAVHVRRNDFLDTRFENIEIYNGPEKLLKVIDDCPFLEPDLPLYIATDEKDKTFFEKLGEKYDIYFYEDFKYNLKEDFNESDKLNIAVMDQVICSMSENFFGTYLSTFTKRINIMRGLDGRQADDWFGINHMPESPNEDITSTIPWSTAEDNYWHWNHSSHYQWMKEINGKLVYV